MDDKGDIMSWKKLPRISNGARRGTKIKEKGCMSE